MAKIQVSPILALPVVVLPALIKINQNVPCKSEMTPFSAVAPAQVVAVSRIQVETSLETIYEDEIFVTSTVEDEISIASTVEDDHESDDDFDEVAIESDFKSPPATLLSPSSSTTCFLDLELHKLTFSSAVFSHNNFQFAN